MPLRNLNRSYGLKRIAFTGKTGVIGTSIPDSGEQGPSLLYEGLPSGYETREYQGFVTSYPTSGELEVYSDSSFYFEGAEDGVYYIGFNVYQDGVFISSETAVIAVGDVEIPVDPTTPDQDAPITVVSSPYTYPVKIVIKSPINNPIKGT